jgi:hypothetical protein
MVESENIDTAKQRLLETRFRSNKYARINQRVNEKFTPFSIQWLPKTHYNIKRDSTDVFVITGNLGIIRRFR